MSVQNPLSGSFSKFKVVIEVMTFQSFQHSSRSGIVKYSKEKA